MGDGSKAQRPGELLGQLLRTAEMSQRELAEQTGVTRNAVNQYAACRRLGDDEMFWSRADELLGAEGALLEVWHTALAAKGRKPRVRKKDRAAAQASGALVPGGVSESSESGCLRCGEARPGTVLLDIEPGGWNGEGWAGWGMRRREAMGLLLWALAALRLDPDERTRTTGALALPGRVDARVVEHVTAMGRAIVRDEDTSGPHEVLLRAVAAADAIQVLARGCAERWRPHLLAAYATTATSIMYYCDDLRIAAASTYGEKALEAAGNAGRLGRIPMAYVLSSQAYCLAMSEKPNASIIRQLAEAALAEARRIGDSCLVACAADKLAMAYALDGKGAACLRVRDSALEQAAKGSDSWPFSPAYWCLGGPLQIKRGEDELRLGWPAKAIASVKEALGLLDETYVGQRAFAHLRLGMAYRQSGELEEAARVILIAAELVTQHHSARLASQLRRQRECMTRWPVPGAVDQLDMHLARLPSGLLIAA